MEELFVKETKVKYGNPLVEKSFAFSVRIVNTYKTLIKRDIDLIPLYKQILRSGTSLGANISEAQCGITKKDFVFKLRIALKESQETEYWLKQFTKTKIISEREFDSLYVDCTELIKLLTSIIKSAKQNQ